MKHLLWQFFKIVIDSLSFVGDTMTVKNCHEFYLWQKITVKFLSSIQKKLRETSEKIERNLMYIDTWINQKPTKSTTIDFGAANNFILEVEASD